MLQRNSKAIALGTIFLAALAVVIGCLAPSVAFRTVAVSPLIFVMPGYSIMRAAQARSSNLETAVLSVALSMAVTVLGGLLLNAVGAFSVFGWTGLLAAIAIAASLVSIGSGAPEMAADQRTRSLRPRPAYWGACALALAVGLGAIAVARAGAERQHQYSFTELWMVAGSGSNENLATIGVRNEENVTTTYEIALSADGAALARRSGIVLRPGETWTDVMPLNGRMGRASRVEASLFRANEPDTIYREAWISNACKTANSSEDQK